MVRTTTSPALRDRKSTRLNSSHGYISYAVFCLKKKNLQSTGVADTSYWGPEIEFYIFDNIRFDQSYNYGFYYIDSEEGAWNTGSDARPNHGYKPRYKEGYFPVPPMDHQHDLRSEMVRTLEKCGVVV